MDDLFNSVHPQPIASVYEWIPTKIFWHKRLIPVWLVTEIQFADTPLGGDATVICLVCLLNACLSTGCTGASKLEAYIHYIHISLFSLGFHASSMRSSSYWGLHLENPAQSQFLEIFDQVDGKK